MSDIVGRITLAPNQYLNLEYAFRLDHKTWELNRSEVSLSAGNALFRIGADYVNLKSSEDVNADRTQKINFVGTIGSDSILVNRI